MVVQRLQLGCVSVLEVGQAAVQALALEVGQVLEVVQDLVQILVQVVQVQASGLGTATVGI